MKDLTLQQIHDLIMLKAELRSRYVNPKALEPGGFHSSLIVDQHLICEIEGMRNTARFILQDHYNFVPELAIPSWAVTEYISRRDKILGTGSN